MHCNHIMFQLWFLLFDCNILATFPFDVQYKRKKINVGVEIPIWNRLNEVNAFEMKRIKIDLKKNEKNRATGMRRIMGVTPYNAH